MIVFEENKNEFWYPIEHEQQNLTPHSHSMRFSTTKI